MWNRDKHIKRRCECGMLISQAWRDKLHSSGVFHTHHLAIKQMIKSGASFAAIARKLNVTRSLVRVQYLRYKKDNK